MGSTKTRLDVALVERGLAASRERAQALIMAGQVRVDGQVVSKASASVAAESQVALDVPDHPYVGRGGVKLAHALDDFKVDPAGRRALDVGASTGGFTDVLLQRGAASVIALDVGHGQLDWTLRNDPRVLVIEHFNARRYFDAHEVWEEIWLQSSGDTKLFYQMLIQAAVGLYHYERGNARGARGMHANVVDKLDRLPSFLMSLDLVDFSRQFRGFFTELIEHDDEAAPPIDRPRPRIQLLSRDTADWSL